MTQNENLNSEDYNRVFDNIEKLLEKLTDSQEGLDKNLKNILQEIINDRNGNNSQPNFEELSDFANEIYEKLDNNLENTEICKKLLCDIVDIFHKEQNKINYAEYSNREINIENIIKKINTECQRYSL